MNPFRAQLSDGTRSPRLTLASFGVVSLFVRRLRHSLVALFALTIWFTATQHCNLEAAGILQKQCSENCAIEGSKARDGCGVVESAHYKSTSALLKVSAPDLKQSTFFLCLLLLQQVPPPEPAITPVETEATPQGWVATWHFDRRSAPLSRAPALALA